MIWKSAGRDREQQVDDGNWDVPTVLIAFVAETLALVIGGNRLVDPS